VGHNLFESKKNSQGQVQRQEPKSPGLTPPNPQLIHPPIHHRHRHPKGKKRPMKQKTPLPHKSHTLPTTNLPLWNRLNPTNRHIQRHNHNPHDPKTLLIQRPMISEQNRKNHTTQITHGANRAAKDSIRVRVHVRHEREIGAVARFEENGHAGDETEHHAFVVGVEEADGDEEGARGDADEGDPGVFEPEVFGDFGVEEVGDYAAEGSGKGYRC